MKCEHVSPLLFAYDEGELDAQELELVETHVADCVACRRELESERRLTALLTRRRSPRPSTRARFASTAWAC